VIVAGATGYIGRSVVRELLAQGIPTAALVRSFDMPEKTVQCLRGATIIQCDVLDPESTKDAYSKFMPTSTICCLASRSGVKLDAWAVDYGGGLNLLQAQELIASTLYSQQQEQGAACNFVLLSAFCVGKPLLQFQFAKLKLEDRIRQSPTLSHSIVRPTAFFKSLDGQVETVRKGLPVLYFGDGTCAANAICERDLARYLIDCVLRAKEVGMVNSSRDIGGPDVPPITKREQIELIYDTLDVPQEKRLAVSLPIEIFDVLIFLFSQLEGFFQSVNAPSLKQRFEDAAEIARIVRYYATEPMVRVCVYVCMYFVRMYISEFGYINTDLYCFSIHSYCIYEEIHTYIHTYKHFYIHIQHTTYA
jgi:divinyl chlorophyllide a 8-vinyl-reductase